MKKMMATILGLAMLLSVFTAIPAQAYGSNPDYPFIWETYETPESIDFASAIDTAKGAKTFVTEGANGSAGSIGVHLQNGYGSGGNYAYDLRYNTPGLNPTGDRKVVVSAKVKLNSPLQTEDIDSRPTNRVALIFMLKGTIYDNGDLADDHATYGIGKPIDHWIQKNIDGQMETGVWKEISATVDAWPKNSARSMSVDGTSYTMKYDNIQVNSICIRVGDVLGYKISAAEDGSLDYQVDDFKVEYADNLSATNVDTTGTVKTAKDHTVTNKVDTSKALSEQTGWSNADVSLGSVQVGRLYKISGTAQYDSATEEGFTGTQAKLRIYLSHAVNRKNGNATTYELDTTFLTAANNNAYPDTHTNKLNPVFPAGQPYDFAYYYYIDDSTFSYATGLPLNVRLTPDAKSKSGVQYDANNGAAGTFSFKNVKIEDLGTPGDAWLEEKGADDIPVIHNASNLYENLASFYNNKRSFGWSSCETITEEGGNVYYKQSGSASLLPGSYTATFQNGESYIISFRAKSEILADGETRPLKLVLDRTSGDCATMRADADYVFDTPTYEYPVAGEITNQWKEYKISYTPNFALKEGATSIRVKNVDTMPIRPLVKFMLSNNYEGETSSSISYDDFKITRVPSDASSGNYATIENISVSGNAEVGGAITVNYDYIPYVTETENKDASLIRAYIKNADSTETNIGTFVASESFTVPELAYGKEIYFKVIPVSTTGGVGNTAVSAPVAIAKTNILTYSSDKGVVAYSPEDSAKVIFATYTGKELVDVKTVDATFVDYKFTCDVPEDLEAGDSMKIMLWKDLTSFAPLATPVN